MQTFNELVDKAKVIVQNGRVLNAAKYATSRVWFCEIFDQKHLYEVLLDEADQHLDTCNCQLFKSEHVCEHVLAAEMYLSTKGIMRQISYTSDRVPSENTVTHPFKQYATRQLVPIQKHNVSIELDIIFHTQKSYLDQLNIEIQLKVIKNKVFKISNPEQFITSYFKKIPYKLSKKEHINWHIDRLSLEDKFVMEWLQMALEYEPKSLKHAIAKKSIALHPLLMPQLKETILHKTNCQLFATIANTTIALSFSTNVKDTLQLTIYTKNVPKIRLVQSLRCVNLASRYAIIDDTLLFLETKEQAELLHHLFHQQNDKQHIIFDDKPSFYQYVLPVVEQVGTVTYEQEITHESLMVEMVYDTNEITLSIQNRFLSPVKATSCLQLWSFLEQEQFVNHFNGNFTKEGVTKYQFAQFVQYVSQFATIQHHDDIALMTFDEPVSIALDDLNGLFEINFSIDHLDTLHMQTILEAIQKQEAVAELSNGKMVELDDDYFQPMHAVLRSIRGKYRIKDGKIMLNAKQAIHVAGENEIMSRSSDIDALINDLKHPENFNCQLPQTLQTTLKPYQVLGFKWLKMLSHHQLGGILADDMGLGKTIQAIAYVLSEYEENRLNEEQCLIVAPTSLLYNWQHEIQTIAPSLSVDVIHGMKTSRVETIQQSSARVLITSYQSFRQDESIYRHKNWHCVILDESQMVKNSNTKMHHSLRHLNTQRRFALSGTPIENRKEELWSIFSLILPGLLPSLREYNRLEHREIVTLIKPFILRRIKSQVLHELPDVVENILYNELSDEQKELYVGYLQQIQQKVSAFSEVQLTQNRMQILSAITRLRQICNHPKLFMEDYVYDSGKLQQFLEHVHRALANGHRILVFSQFARMLSILQVELDKIGYSSFVLDGQTPPSKRQEMVELFNSGQKDVFFISLKAGGTGLNLTSADTIILYDLWWNPAVEEQAKSRAHRIGQKNTVHVYRMVSQGTIEEKMIALQDKKKALFDEMIDTHVEMNEHYQKLTNNDIKEILGIHE
ncbi:SNF2 helicase associated domain-containing protein [Carnobacteriaceae bacterium zg-C25]|nr:SNF2 helicase associated domain-containing protein [Carnobacteriaceae bacterium zg-C25]